jgi:hypothetical protein
MRLQGGFRPLGGFLIFGFNSPLEIERSTRACRDFFIEAASGGVAGDPAGHRVHAESAVRRRAVQDKGSTSSASRVASRSKEIVAAHMEMPADKFSLKLTPEGMTFGQFTLHVAAANYLIVQNRHVLEPELPKISDTGTKDKLVERLKSRSTSALPRSPNSTIRTSRKC